MDKKDERFQISTRHDRFKITQGLVKGIEPLHQCPIEGADWYSSCTLQKEIGEQTSIFNLETNDGVWKQDKSETIQYQAAKSSSGSLAAQLDTI